MNWWRGGGPGGPSHGSGRLAGGCGRCGAGGARGRRCDCPYVIVYRHRGRQHTETFRTMAEAREGKRKRESQIARGEFAPLTKTTFHDFAREWIDRYQGTGRRGFRHENREEYRALLDRYALRYFPPTMTLTQIDPREIAEIGRASWR